MDRLFMSEFVWIVRAYRRDRVDDLHEPQSLMNTNEEIQCARAQAGDAGYITCPKSLDGRVTRTEYNSTAGREIWRH